LNVKSAKRPLLRQAVSTPREAEQKSFLVLFFKKEHSTAFT